MIVLAIDPGSERSGWVVFDSATMTLRAFAKSPNDDLLAQLRAGISADVDAVVIEWTAPRGMPASAQLFETMWWAGRFAEAVERSADLFAIPITTPLAAVHRIERAVVKRHLTGRQAATDTNIRAALIDRFGGIGGKEAAIGRKAAPGPLHGVTADCWAALAVAVTFADDPELRVGGTR